MYRKTPKNNQNHSTIEEHHLVKHQSMLSNLASYLELAICSNMYNRGFATLLNTRHKFKQLHWKPIPINVYNILLTGLADRGNYAKMRELLKVLREDETSLNAQTYAAIFECLERTSTIECNNEIHIKKYAQEANAQVRCFVVRHKNWFNISMIDFRIFRVFHCTILWTNVYSQMTNVKW